jgi:hypothetical protein
VVPACLVAAHAGNVADAAHDSGVARAMGLVGQPWRGLDVVAASMLAWLPLGTRALRAELGEGLVVALAGIALYRLALGLVARCAAGPRLGPAIAGIATLAALCSPAWQTEAASVGGSALGALLVLLPVSIAAGGSDDREPVRWRLCVLALAMALGFEPLVGACALLAVAVFVAVNAETRHAFPAACRTDARGLGACLLAGLVPLLLAVARTRASGVPLGQAFTDGWAGEAAASSTGSPVAFVRAELGTAVVAMAIGGVVLMALVSRARPVGAALLALVVVGLACGWVGAPLGPTRFGAPVLAAMAATYALTAVTMHSLVRAIAEARVPMARASAVMVIVLELVLPVDAADEALLRTLPRASGAASLWDDLTWGTLPPRTVALVPDIRLWSRAAAAQASGSLRGDIAVVPTHARGSAVERALAEDAALVPLWRDLELQGSPSEASLSSLAAARPLVTAYEPRWGRALGRHLVPVALLDRFEPEPRGASDRRRALDAFASRRERLTRVVGKDPELARAAAYLLRARALDVAASGDRDLVGRAVEDLHAFAPEDPVGTAIVARVVLGHGVAKVDDLRP